ncbi:ABC transporter ATP-binding protein (plasmid) [Streptomyces sp. BHT-5-2]|uniref:ATP-binding cassette domain-containing protein n=1 Tax=unclassified Streptomyces TaxID=2593676 RepID=UPI001C8E10C7|nr:ABC transporter ATP-binding protein [Streptomyces sp. BHT-5-2]
MILRGVRKAHGRRLVLRGASLTVPSGMLVGVVGENGGGKSTLLRIACGQLAPDGGEVRRTGAVGYCPQRLVLDDALTVEQHLRYFQVAYQLPDLRWSEELLEILALAGFRGERAGVLSGGTRQKLNLVLALMHDPDLLLLDEPYQGFDWETYQRFWELTVRLRERGRAIVMVSHLALDIGRFDEVHYLREGLLYDSSGVAEAAATVANGRGVVGG